jgi:hypothetical protein
VLTDDGVDPASCRSRNAASSSRSTNSDLPAGAFPTAWPKLPGAELVWAWGGGDWPGTQHGAMSGCRSLTRTGSRSSLWLSQGKGGGPQPLALTSVGRSNFVIGLVFEMEDDWDGRGGR